MPHSFTQPCSSKEVNARNDAVSFEGEISGVSANWVKPPRFRSVLLAATLTGIIAMGGAGHAAATGSGAPSFPESDILISAEACYAHMTIAEMTTSADLVVTGRVLGSSTPYPHIEMPGAGPIYYRDVYVSVDQVLKGAPQTSLFSRGLVVADAGEALPHLEGSEAAAVIAIRTTVDHYGNSGFSTGMGEITPGTEALYFLDRRESVYRLLLGEGSMYRPTTEGAYHDSIEGDFTLADIAPLVNPKD